MRPQPVPRSTRCSRFCHFIFCEENRFLKEQNDYWVITLVALAHGSSHFFQMVVAPLFPLIKEDLGVSYAALGFAMALFYTLSALFQPLAGFVVDRFGARAVLLGGVDRKSTRLNSS